MTHHYENARRAGKTDPGRIELMPAYLERMKAEGKNPGAHTKHHQPRHLTGRAAYRTMVRPNVRKRRLRPRPLFKAAS